jgi:hypothetical protein
MCLLSDCTDDGLPVLPAANRWPATVNALRHMENIGQRAQNSPSKR